MSLGRTDSSDHSQMRNRAIGWFRERPRQESNREPSEQESGKGRLAWLWSAELGTRSCVPIVSMSPLAMLSAFHRSPSHTDQSRRAGPAMSAGFQRDTEAGARKRLPARCLRCVPWRVRRLNLAGQQSVTVGAGRGFAHRLVANAV